MKRINVQIDVPLHGEDAPSFVNDRCAVICDGLGGAGVKKYIVEGEERSLAYYASRVVSKTVSSFLTENYSALYEDNCLNLKIVVNSLKEAIITDLKEFSSKYGIGREGDRISGSMIKVLPTTLASFAYKEVNNCIDVICIWAGDSRCYCVDARGLHQLTIDDADGSRDAMDCYLLDSPMNNVISLSKDFRLNIAVYRIKEPCLIFAASDGVFSYQGSPMQFELVLLPTPGEPDYSFEDKVTKLLTEYSYDDSSLAGCIFGLKGLDRYANLMRSRSERLHRICSDICNLKIQIEKIRNERNRIKGLERNPENDCILEEIKTNLKKIEREYEEKRKAIWKKYKKKYEIEELRIAYREIPKKVASIIENAVSDKEDEGNSSLVDDIFNLFLNKNDEEYHFKSNWQLMNGYSVVKYCDNSDKILFGRKADVMDYITIKDNIKDIDFADTPHFNKPIKIQFDKQLKLLIMSFVDGETVPIRDLRYKFSLETNIRLFAEMIKSLNWLHSRGIIHGSFDEKSVIVLNNDSPRTVIRNYCNLRRSNDELCKSDIIAMGKLIYLGLTGTNYTDPESMNENLIKYESSTENDANKIVTWIKIVSKMINGEVNSFELKDMVADVSEITNNETVEKSITENELVTSETDIKCPDMIKTNQPWVRKGIYVYSKNSDSEIVYAKKMTWDEYNALMKMVGLIKNPPRPLLDHIFCQGRYDYFDIFLGTRNEIFYDDNCSFVVTDGVVPTSSPLKRLMHREIKLESIKSLIDLIRYLWSIGITCDPINFDTISFKDNDVTKPRITNILCCCPLDKTGEKYYKNIRELGVILSQIYYENKESPEQCIDRLRYDVRESDNLLLQLMWAMVNYSDTTDFDIDKIMKKINKIYK